MAEARRCDRCNEFYSINDINEKRGEYPITASYKKMVYSMSLYDNYVSRIKHLDLCPKCSRSLIVWLNDWGQYEETVLDKLVQTDIPNSGFGECPYYKSESSGLMCKRSSTCDEPCNMVELYKMKAESEDKKKEKPEVKEIDVRDNHVCKTCKFHSIPIFERPCSVCNNYDMYSAQVAIAKAEDVLKNVLNVAKMKDCKHCKYDELCDNAFTENDPCYSCDNFDNFEPKEDSE